MLLTLSSSRHRQETARGSDFFPDGGFACLLPTYNTRTLDHQEMASSRDSLRVFRVCVYHVAPITLSTQVQFIGGRTGPPFGYSSKANLTNMSTVPRICFLQWLRKRLRTKFFRTGGKTTLLYAISGPMGPCVRMFRISFAAIADNVTIWKTSVSLCSASARCFCRFLIQNKRNSQALELANRSIFVQNELFWVTTTTRELLSLQMISKNTLSSPFRIER